MKKILITIAGIWGIIFVILFLNSYGKVSVIETVNQYLQNDRVVTSKIGEKYKYNELMAPERTIKQGTDGEKICYLTFDDGPSENTVKILDILKQYDAKATFFVIGNCIGEETRKILERIIEEGHAIGLHANNHVYEKFYANETSYLKDYEDLYDTLKREYGIETALFRLPGGSACKFLYGRGSDYIKEMRERGFACFDWNVTGEDSIGKPTVESIQKNVYDRVFRYEEPIVLLHDSCIADKTVEALPGMLEEIKEKGYSFATLENREEYTFSKK